MEKVKLQLSVTVGCPKTIAQESETISGGAIIVGVVVSLVLVLRLVGLPVTAVVLIVVALGIADLGHFRAFHYLRFGIGGSRGRETGD